MGGFVCLLVSCMLMYITSEYTLLKNYSRVVFTIWLGMLRGTIGMGWISYVQSFGLINRVWLYSKYNMQYI